MIVERIEVKNWRHLRDEHVFEFDKRMNLLVGPNEAGKSTLFEILQRTLFDRHTSQAQEIKNIRPIGSSLAPEAKVTLRSGDDRYLVHKRFLDGPLSEFSVKRDGEWEREHEGDRADEEARNLIDGDVAHGATKVEHRGLGQALWYLQREPPLPENEWNEAIQEGLGGLLDVAATSPVEQRVVDRAQEAYGEHWTPKTASLKTTSPITALEEEIDSLESELEEASSSLKLADDHRTTLEGYLEERNLQEEALEKAEERQEELREAVREGKELEDNKEKLRREVEDAEEQVRKTQRDLDELERLEEAIEELEVDLDDAREREAEKQQEARLAKESAEQARRQRREELEPTRREIAEQIEGLRARERVLELETKAEKLETRRDELQDLQAELEDRRSSIRELRAPGDDVMEEYRKARQDLAVVSAQAEASAIHVGFDFEGDPSVSAEPSAEAEEGEREEFLVTRPTVFTVGDLGTVSVRGGGEDLEELQAQAEKLQDKLDEIEERFNADSQEELDELNQRRNTLSVEIESLEQKIDDLSIEKEDPEDALARVKTELGVKQKRTEQLSENRRHLKGDALVDEIKDLQERQDEIQAKIEAAEQEQEEAVAQHESLLEEAQEESNEVSSLRATIKERRSRRGEIIDAYGTFEQLEKEHEERVRKHEELAVELDELSEQFEKQVGKPRKELEGVEEEIEGLEDQIHALDRDVAETRGRVETIANEGVYARTGDLEAKIDNKKRRLKVLRTRAEGAKLLKELLDELREERTAALAGPVSTKVNRWLEMLTDGRYDFLRIDENLRPQAVQYVRYDAPLEIDQLSYGTHEQIVVLFRLAIGSVLGADQRRLVILDDRLVNADPVRTRRLCEILEDAAATCQILMATCAQSRYARLSGQTLRIPEDGRIERDD